jgi:hypothetical protein
VTQATEPAQAKPTRGCNNRGRRLAPALTAGANLHGLGLAQADGERKPYEHRQVGVDRASPSRVWELFGTRLPRCLVWHPGDAKTRVGSGLSEAAGQGFEP